MSIINKLILDIETVGADFNSFDETTQDSLTRWIKKNLMEMKIIKQL